MKPTIKIILTLLFCFLPVFTMAVPETNISQIQPQHPQPPQPPKDGKVKPPKFSPEAFKRDLSNYISSFAEFSNEEAKKFFPVYFEMKDKLRNIEHQKGRALHRAAQQNMREKDCARILHECTELDKKAQRIEAQYMARLQKQVGAKKLLKAIVAERTFGRDTFKRMTKK